MNTINSSVVVNRKKHYQLLNSAAIKAKTGLKIMTIDQSLNRNNISAIPERKVYYDTLESITKNKPNITIERIYGLPKDVNSRTDKIKWIRRDLEKYKNCPNYHMYIFDWRKFESIPTPISIQIVDDNFAGLVNMQHPETGVLGGGEDICIMDSIVVKHFQVYFEAIRERCLALKVGERIDLNVLK